MRRAAAHPVAELLRAEPRVRPFFAAQAQSALGTGAACVALLVLAHDRLNSPWAITLILLADLAPAMALGPVFGALADRVPRRRCVVAADALRAAAFAGIAVVGSFPAMLGFALLAGLGTALFRPAMMAGLPSLVADRRRPAATALFSALDDLGYTVGPAAAAGLLLLAGPATVVLLNGASFAISAVVLARAPFGPVPAVEPGNSEDGGSLVAQAREGLRAASALPGVRTVILGSSGVVLFAGLFNVAELLLAGDELHAGAAGYAVVVGVFGLGVAAGSLRGARGGGAAELGRRYLAGLLLTGAGFVACGLAPSFAAATVTFALAGAGNGLVLVHERLLLQALVPDRLGGRVFGVKDALQSWAFLPGLAGAAALIPVIGTRTLLVLAGAGVLLVWAATWRALTPAVAPRRAVALVAATAER